MDGDGLNRSNSKGFLDLGKTAQTELVDLCQGIGILPVVLDDIDVVGDSEEAGEGGTFRVPEGC